MSASLLLALSLTCGAPTAVAGDSANDPAVIWRDGVTYAAFTSAFSNRKRDWRQRDGWAVISDSLMTRARALPMKLRVLAVAEEMCNDSMNSIPYLARLAELTPMIELHIVNSARGRSIMEAFRTPDGRAATPTVVVLDANGRVAGCWIERPERLRKWSLTPRDSLPKDQRFEDRRGWYENDKGRSAMAEWIPMLERIARGESACEPKVVP